MAVRAGEAGGVWSSPGKQHRRWPQMTRGFQRASPAASSLARFLPTSTRLVWPSSRGVTNGVEGLLWFAAKPKGPPGSWRVGG